MLSRLVNITGNALSPLREWEVRFDTHGERDEGSSSAAGTALVIDLRALRSLMPLLPEHVLQNIAMECVAPACNSVRNIIKKDLDHVVDVLSSLQLEPEDNPFDSIEDMDVSTACPLNLVSSPQNAIAIPRSYPHSVSEQHSSALIQPHEQEFEPCHTCRPRFTIPTILVSPCAPSEHHMSCRVPIQNSAFGDQLTVPSYPVFNHIFPPMVLPEQPLLALQNWTWKSGHWQATLPSICEQEMKGLFSRVLKRKRIRRKRICR